ncbi:DUF126 domain-containing protein (plasmid) [Pseudomonas sp. MPC6]|nr:DUF126 domain-containing protein [Pseudomonas sp. MPC6]
MLMKASVLNPGSVSGQLLVLDEPLSFWGGYDPLTGTIIDQQHPQVGLKVTGKVLVMPGTRGSSGTPGVLGESLRLGTGPIGLILGKPDVNVMAAALVVSELYDLPVPVLVLDKAGYAHLHNGQMVRLESNGEVLIQR